MKSGLTVVITGAASGIGRALALECERRGCTVYAADLSIEAMADMRSPTLHPLKMDVNSADDIRALVDRLQTDAALPDVLINNAGFGAVAPLLDLPLERLRLQFETNVFSVVALCQALAPRMAAKGSGRIVNIGSISGVMATPFAGAYCGTKAALHVLSDALRMELKPFGIDVIVVMPSAVRSNFGARAVESAKPLKPGSLYQPIARIIEARAMLSQQQQSISAEAFAVQMMDAITRKHPAPVIAIGPGARLITLLRRFLPLSLIDRVLSGKFELDKCR